VPKPLCTHARCFSHSPIHHFHHFPTPADTIIQEKVASEREVSEFLEFSRPAFQRWKGASPGCREKSDAELLPVIISVFHAHRKRYGARRIAEELHHRGYSCCRDRAAKLLKVAGLRAIQPKSFKPRSTESRHSLGYSPNLILDLAEPAGINELWVGDITYIPVASSGFCYLSILMDRFSRRILGWTFGDDMTESLVTSSLKKAISNRQPPPNVIHHTDRGGQYAATRYRAILRRASMRQSMSRAGDCYDNAFMESCFGTIKVELEMTEYQTYRMALKDITEYISHYNIERRHSSIGYLSPSQFEATSPR
jgi:putative transposase